MTATEDPTGRFDPRVLGPDQVRRRVVLEILEAALAAVDPGPAVSRSLAGFDQRGARSATLVAFGKAAPAMATAAAQALSDLVLEGLVVSNHSAAVPSDFQLRISGHPLPDYESVRAGAEALSLVKAADDLVVVLVSGGGSALVEVPAPGLELSDLIETNRVLVLSHVPIEEINAVRKHLSALKGGRLAEAARGRRLVTLILSDVVASPVNAIASGPTVPDPTTYADALEVLRRHDLLSRVPTAVVDLLGRGQAGGLPETPKTSHPDHLIHVVADGATAAEGAHQAAIRGGLDAEVITTKLAGPTREAARGCLAASTPGLLSLFAGETTVEVIGDGRGGRNQEAALTAAMELEGDTGTVFAALATDGIDGPTSAAGAIVDGETVRRGRAAGLDPVDHLFRNDAYPYLEATGDLLRSGPTGTNVGDLWMVWRGSEEQRKSVTRP